MLKATWNSLSLRASLAASMALILLPLLASAVGGYLIIKGTVIADYQDVAYRQHYQLVPLQSLQLAISQAEIPLDDYLLLGAPEKLQDFRFLHQETEVAFNQLITQLEDDPEIAALVERAWTDWSRQEDLVAEMLAARELNAQDRLTEARSRFNSLQASANEKLAAAYELVEAFIDADYLDAERGFERSEWIAAISAAVSLLMMIVGLGLIGHTLRSSVTRLVEGAKRFSEGDREHRIDVQVPPELQRVAEEFNRMIAIIHESEDGLIDQARRDKLTGLLNRRAYDDAMAEAYQRLQRNGERMALIALDIDHFKRVNDTWGHDAGDDVLRYVAAATQAALRGIDKVFRTGGEEFSIILPGADDTAARTAAERIRQAVENLEIPATGGKIRVTVSQGVALANSHSESPTSVKKQADVGLYQAKTAGRNRVVAMTASMAGIC